MTWAFDPKTHSVLDGDEGDWSVVATVTDNENGPLLAASPELLAVLEVVLRGSQTWYVPGDVVDRLERAVALARPMEGE